jgi:hypothetical protein
VERSRRVGLVEWPDRPPGELMVIDNGMAGVEIGRRGCVVTADRLALDGPARVAEIGEPSASGSCEDEVNRAGQGVGGSGDSSASTRQRDQVRPSVVDSLAGRGKAVGGQAEANGHGSGAGRDGLSLIGHGACITVPYLSSKQVALGRHEVVVAEGAADRTARLAWLRSYGSLDERVAEDPLGVAGELEGARTTLVLDAAARAGLDVHENIRPTELEVQAAQRLVRELEARGVGQEDWW